MSFPAIVRWTRASALRSRTIGLRLMSSWPLLMVVLLLPATTAATEVEIEPTARVGEQARNIDIHAQFAREEAVNPEKQRVLVLNSYNKGYNWTDNEVEAIQEAFADDPNVILQMEFMDTKLINTDRHFRLLKRLYANKYDGVEFDVIIATDDDALTFLKRYREALFPGVPVVFAGINNFTPAKIDGLERVTGVNEQADFEANLELILRLQPDVRHVHVLSDGLTAGKLIREEFEAAAAAFSDRLNFYYIPEMTIEDVATDLGLLPKDSVVFYLTFFRDGSGRALTPLEAIPTLSEASAVPLYGQVDYMIGKGILGGIMKSSSFQGTMAARLAKRVLAGEDPESIPIVMDSTNHYMFDYQQLRRFEIPFKRLPPDSLMVNVPRGLYYQYKTLIWSLTATFLVLLGFILVLLVNIRQRKRAQQGLQDILVAMTSVLELGSANAIKEVLVETINRVIFLDKAVQLVALFNYSGPLHAFDECKLTALPWCGEPSTSAGELDDEKAMPLIREAIELGGSVVAENECVALFKTNSIKANIVYLRGGRRFEEMDRDLLEILTNNVAMAVENLEKSKMQQSLETAKKIQLSMLPHDFQRLAEPFNVDLCARLVPANEVGGDLYDVYDIDADHLLVAVGDVADKGVPAALFMAMSKTLIRAESERSRNPAEILCKVNNELAKENSQCLFVTLFLGVLDRRSRVLRYANGGHNPPYVVQANGGVEPLPILQSPALGVIDDAIYQEQSIQLHTGDALFAYSDGVTEAENTAAEMFGEARLEAMLRRSIGMQAVDFTQDLLHELDAFARGAGQADDITMLLVRMT